MSYTYLGPQVQDYMCGTEDASTWITVLTTATYSDSDYDSYYSSYYYTDEILTLAPMAVPQAATPATASAATTSSASTHTSDPKPTNVGAIAGGAVAGAVALCAAIGVGVFFFFRRKQKKSQQQGAPLQNMAMGAPPPGQDGSYPHAGAQSMYVHENKYNPNVQYYQIPQGYGPAGVSPPQGSPMMPFSPYMPHQQMPMDGQQMAYGGQHMPGQQMPGQPGYPATSPSLGVASLQREPSGHSTGSMSPPQQPASPSAFPTSTSPKPSEQGMLQPRASMNEVRPDQHSPSMPADRPIYEMGDHR